MKILLIITKSEFGGAQRFVHDMASYLHSQNHHVVIGYGEPGFLATTLEGKGLETHHFKNLKRSFNPVKTLLFLQELRSFVRENHFDVVHCNSSNTLPGILGLNNLPERPITIATLHGLSFAAPEHQSRLKLLYIFLYRFILSRFTSVVYISKRDHDNGVRAGLPEGIIIPLGIPDEFFLPPFEARQKLALLCRDINPKRFLIGAIGRLAYPKNFSFLIEHFLLIKECLPNAQVIIIGEGPDRAELAKKITERQLEKDIFLTGSVAGVSCFMKGLDLLIVPSTYEGVPYVALEALQARIPVLLSAVGGMPEIVPTDFLFILTAENFRNGLTMLKERNFPVPPLLPTRTLQAMGQAYLSIYQSHV